mmetsp:Transcript_35963/g.95442  ORF Transcript_35963/g.95442 Transcript_35963/m.95442 type:complete len:246 (+) Transcript_35963:340-1077(+)
MFTHTMIVIAILKEVYTRVALRKPGASSLQGRSLSREPEATAIISPTQFHTKLKNMTTCWSTRTRMGRRCGRSESGDQRQSHFVTHRLINTSNTIAPQTTSAQACRGTSQWCRKSTMSSASIQRKMPSQAGARKQSVQPKHKYQQRKRSLRTSSRCCCTTSASASGPEDPCSKSGGLNRISCAAEGPDALPSLGSTRTSSSASSDFPRVTGDTSESRPARDPGTAPCISRDRRDPQHKRTSPSHL